MKIEWGPHIYGWLAAATLVLHSFGQYVRQGMRVKALEGQMSDMHKDIRYIRGRVDAIADRGE